MSDHPLPFQGEIMRCYKCRRRWKSDPETSLFWTAIDTELPNGTMSRSYLCPACMGVDPDWWKTHKKECNCGHVKPKTQN